jgi:hypothetical protein
LTAALFGLSKSKNEYAMDETTTAEMMLHPAFALSNDDASPYMQCERVCLFMPDVMLAQT